MVPFETQHETIAHNLFCGMQACLEEVFGDISFCRRSVAIQGFDEVAYLLAKQLHTTGATLYISDSDPAHVAIGVREFNATPLLGHEIYRMDVDIFSPCAMERFLNEQTVPRLSCKIIAGSAPNQLKEKDVADLLQRHDILYAPDWIIRGSLSMGPDTRVTPPDLAEQGRSVYNQLKAVFALAKKKGMTPSEAATQLYGPGS